jgi:hypothetical protein
MVLTKSAFCKSIAGSSRFFLLSCALVGGAVTLSGAPVRAEEAGMWDKVLGTVGLGGAKPADPAPAAPPAGNSLQIAPVQATPAQATPAQATPVPAAPAQARSIQSAPAQANPVQAAPAPALPAPVAAAPEKPGMFDGFMKAVGLGGPKPSETIDYSERPKLAVPQQKVLPPPRESGGPRQIARNPENEALTKPPAEYTEKVLGADGQVSGLKESDVAKEKKFLNFF